MADRLIWELSARDRVLGHARWVGGHSLVLDGPTAFARQVEVWFREGHRRLRDGEVTRAVVRAFFDERLPVRLPGLQARELGVGRTRAAARWLLAIDGDRLPPLGSDDPRGWASNRWHADLDARWLRSRTVEREVRWSRGEHSGFKAGGRCFDASEMWLTLARSGPDMVLLYRREGRVLQPPVRERVGWLRFGPLQRLERMLESRL